MKLLLILSVIASISAIQVPSAWQPQPSQNANLNSNINRDVLPIRPPETVAPQARPNYNNVNAFVNNLPNKASNGLLPTGNIFPSLPVDYSNWFTGAAPNNGFGFVGPTSQISNGNPLGNINTFLNNGNELRRQPYIPQRPGPPGLAPNAINFNRRPVAASSSNAGPLKEGPGQVPYITYTTQVPAPHAPGLNTARPVQNVDSSVNIKKAYPQVTSPKTTVPLTELDFSPLDPFPHGQLDTQASTQINNQNNLFSTVQPTNNFDFNLNNPFPHRQLNAYGVTQFPDASQIPFNKPLLTVVNNQPAHNPNLKQLNFDPFTKNYRDHRTHEPSQYDPYYDQEPIPKVERLESEKAPIVKNHEHPAEVPTKPIYPGEGQWAKPGAKFRPFVSQQQYVNLEDSNKQPDGYDTFLEGQNLFENQKAQFGQRLQQLPSSVPTQHTNTEQASNGGEIFVPTRLYAQVRHSEDEKHLPPEEDENGRLKELIKDTKIQTIYSEEGYEDSAYDHAGHEKKAESKEGYESDEKNEEAKRKKKIPVKKYNRESASYSVGDQNLKEEDIEKLKKEDLNLDDENENEDDSEPAGTHFEEQSYLNKIEPTKTKDPFIRSKEIKVVTAKDRGGGKIELEVSSEVKAVPQPNNSTKLHKYVTIYPKLNKNQTINEDKVKSHNLILNQEKTSKLDADKRSLTLNEHEIFIEEIVNQTSSTTEAIPTTVAPTEYDEIVTIEIPTTTQATTSIPRLEEKNNLSNQEKIETQLDTRKKRAAPEDPEIEIDTDFIDKINHDIGKPTEKSDTLTEKKYPYYKNYKEKGLHGNSPLRYAEDLKNVPIKTGDRLAFYDLADRKMICSDVDPEVDPVPDRIKDADESVEEEEEDEEGNDPATKEPRLGKLGDKIDCFKVKYFGENPLDNPFFQEKTVGPVEPIFSEIEKISSKKIESRKVDNAVKGTNSISRSSELNNPRQTDKAKEPLRAAASSYDSENEIDDGRAYKFGLTSWFPGKNFGMGENTERDTKFVNHFVEKTPNPKINIDSKGMNNDEDNIKAQNSKESSKEVQTLPPATLITTPKYTIDLKPKHIYDQIELLEYLPEDELDEVKKAINADLPKINFTEITTPLPNMNKTEVVLNSPIIKKKKGNKKNSARKAKVLKNTEESMKMDTSDNRNPESLPEVDALQLVRQRPKKPLYEIFDINKYIPKVPKIQFPVQTRRPTPANYIVPVSIQNPTYEVFDINKYLPTTPFPLFKDFITRSTVLPKYKIISEVFYKDDIKPNEQLNVFTDVLKHIQNFPKLKDSFPESSQPISVKLDTEKISDQKIFDQMPLENKEYFSSTITTIMTTFDPKAYASNHKYPKTENPLGIKTEVEDMLDDFKNSNKRKRRRRIKTTTQETPMVIEQSTSTLQYIGEPTEVMGLMPPIIQGYKTIYHPKRDNSQHTANPTIKIEERKINKYFVQGMRPPPKQKVYLYSDFITSNHITQRMTRPKRSKLRRSRRSAQRPAYAQLARNKNNPPDKEPEAKKEEEDDYVPHRPKNYHYDEKTGKIVYDKKPQEQSDEEEEVEYIEVVEETPKTTESPKPPKQNPIFATATPPPEGQSYTDFIKLLKSASNYHEIPDPTTTEKGAEEVTQKVVASTLDPVSTSPPEFLSILAKVRNDTTYKLIEDEKDKKKTTTSKTPQEEEEEEIEEESQVDDIKNSPGGQGYENGANLEIFDISDFLPNIKSYLPKTSIDTSKYKTIERPHLRHSLSSRYNSEADKDLQNINTNKQPILPSSEAVERRSERVQTTTQKPVRSPSRRRTTTVKSTTREDGASTTQATLTTLEPIVVQNDKPRRNYRRRPARIRLNPTTESSLEAAVDNTTKIVHRRSERDSHMYAEGNEKYEQFVEADGNVPKSPIRTEDYVDYEEITDSPNITNTQQIENIGAVAQKVVDISKNYNKDQKHGGNYKKEDEVSKQIVPAPEAEKKVKESVEIVKEYDKTKKHGGNYKAEKEDIVKPKEQVRYIKKDPKIVKKIEVFKDYDKTKKHGGNYRPANENININEQDDSSLEKNESVQIKNVNIFQDYDKTKKHGGNYKSENDTLDEQKVNVNLENPVLLKNIEIFKDFDKTKKHGGNYRPDKDVVVQEQQLEESQLPSPQFRQNILNDGTDKKSSVEVFKNYDTSKKHGGNYRRENESIQSENPTQQQDFTTEKAKDVEIFKEYNEEQKTGGNYRREEESVVEPKADETQYSKSKAPQNKRFIDNRNDAQSLADGGLKPETFYSDISLPLDINALKIVKDLPTEEIEEIVKSAEDDTENKEDGLTSDKPAGVKPDDVKSDGVVTIGNKLKNSPVIEKPITTTKKPLFIKDPSKRLYFYAPIR